MVRNIDYEARKRAILAATINQYIEEAKPIASEDIAKGFNLSSSTIRNIFAELEESGYLAQPHTSGGRVPTNKGYRYYVDFLVSQMELLDNEKERVISEYNKKINRLEDILEKTSEVICEITHYAGIVSFLEWQDHFFYRGISQILEEPEFRDLQNLRIFIKLIEEKERLLNIINRDFSEGIKVYIGEELGCPGIENCSLVVSTYSLKNKPSGRLAVLGPKRMEYGHTISTIEYIADVLTDTLNRF
jgi:transcriptional regulator of heat shock response